MFDLKAITGDSNIALDQATFSRRELFPLVAALTLSHSISTKGDDALPEEKITDLKVGEKFPELKLTDQNGKEILLSKVNKDKIILVDFWGIWCGPCIAELPSMRAAYQNLKGNTFKDKESGEITEKGFEIYSVAVQVNDGDTARWKNEFNKSIIPWSYNVETIGFDLPQKYGVTSYPSNFLLDGKGTVIAIDVAPSSIQREILKIRK